MINPGKIVKSDSGRRIRVDGFIASGGQGEAYWATDMNTGEKGVLKVFHKRFANDDTVKRLRFLVGQDLVSACPALCAPIDVIHKRDMVAHYTPRAPGRPLEEFLVNPNSTFLECLQLAISLAHVIGVIHKRQIAHGDIHAENFIINRVGKVFQLFVIDFDNFNAPGMPPPPMVGHNLYLAPEIRDALAHSRPAVPDVYSDRYSLGVLMHEIILLQHIAAGADDNETKFQKAMCSGRWLQDPAASDKPSTKQGGYPVEVLNADLARMFRFALSLDPPKRPAPDSWESELWKAFKSVDCCPACGGPCVVDVSKTACPLCKRPFPHLVIKTTDGKVISLEHGSVRIGRNDLGGSMKVSVLHAIFRRIGPDTWIESLGSNGSYRWTGSIWTKLPDKKPRLVQQGDRLRLGDTEVRLN